MQHPVMMRYVERLRRWTRGLGRQAGFALGFLLLVLFIARYLRAGNFGWYEDDLTIIPFAVEMSPDELLRFVGDYLVGLQGHARPISNSLIYLLSWLGWRLGEMRGLYLVGWAVVALNTVLFYTLIRRRYAPEVALAGGLAYVLYSADTTQAFLTHSLGLQPSITIVLIAFHVYLSGRRVLFYLLAAMLLFSYETPYLLLAAAPLVAWGFTRRAARGTPVHLALLIGLLVAVALLRSAIGEERVTDLSPPAAVATAAEHAVVGPAVSLGTYALRPLQLLRQGPVEGWMAALVSLPFLVWAFLLIGGPGLRPEPADLEERAQDKRLVPRPLLTLVGVGLVLLVLAYPLTFTTRATAVSGRETRVHLAGVVGASMVVGGAAVAALRFARRGAQRWAVAVALGGAFALLLGYGFSIQDDYVEAWRLQREFWSDLLPQIQDAGEGAVVMVDPEGLVDTLQIGANTWNLPRLLAQLYRLPPDWETPPRVYRGVKEWRDYLVLPDGELRIDGDTTEAPPSEHTLTDWNHLIVIHTGSGVARRDRPLIIDEIGYPLPPTGPPVLADLPRDLLYGLLVSP